MKICTNFKDRFTGLMFKKNIKEEYFFPNCHSVHTFFMRMNIDIICVDKNLKIIKIYRNIATSRIIIGPKKTYGILEAKANSSYKEGQVINLKR